MGKKLFVTGTSTDVGKSYVSALFVKKLLQNGINAAYFKPLASGNLRDGSGELMIGDVDFVKKISGLDLSSKDMNVRAYVRAYSPHLAMKIEGDAVSLDEVLDKFGNFEKNFDFITIEGCGGIVCPLRYDDKKFMQADLIKALKCAVVVVADAGLGGINAAVLTSEYIKANGIVCKGFVLNNFDEKNPIHVDNEFMIKELCGVKIIAKIASNQKDIDIDTKELEAIYE